MKLSARLIPITSMLVLYGCSILPQTSYAASMCDSPAIAEYLPPLPNGCHRQRIEASGNLSFNILRSAKGLGLKAWQRAVVTLYGERYQDWDHAACKTVLCVKASISGSQRCTYAAFPCSNQADDKLLAELAKEGATLPVLGRPDMPGSLAPSEIREMQQLLLRAGYRVWVDGIFGERTGSALTAWQRRSGLPANGRPTRNNLEDLRRLVKTYRLSIEPAKKRATLPVLGRPDMSGVLTAPEIREMQRLLLRAGYSVRVDGVFGSRTSGALAAWQRRRGLPNNGVPTRKNLESLRRMARA